VKYYLKENVSIVRIYILSPCIFIQFIFFTPIADCLSSAYLFVATSRNRRSLGAKMLLRPSFSPFSRRGAIPVRVNEGNHHEILWNSEVIRLEHWSWRNQTGSRRQRPPLRKERDCVGQEYSSHRRPAPQLRRRYEHRSSALRA